jgi:hypothetical protein
MTPEQFNELAPVGTPVHYVIDCFVRDGWVTGPAQKLSSGLVIVWVGQRKPYVDNAERGDPSQWMRTLLERVRIAKEPF